MRDGVGEVRRTTLDTGTTLMYIYAEAGWIM